MLLIATMLGLWALLIAARGTPIGRMLDWLLVDAPARALQRVGRGHVFVVIGLVVFVGAVFWIFEAEGVRLLSMAAPDILGVLAMAEVSTYVDLIVMGAVAASTARLRPVVDRLRGLVRRAPRSRARRTRPTDRRTPANDDDGPLRLAIAA